MKTRISLTLTVTTALAALLIAPSGAAAATEFGDNCTVNESFKGSFTIFEVSNPKISYQPLRPAPASSPR